MNARSRRPATTPVTASPAPADFTWAHQWARVPEPWRTGTYRLDIDPFNQVFVRNTNYSRSKHDYDFVPTEYTRLRAESAWWVWSIWKTGARKIDPAMLAWWGRAITALASARAPFGPSIETASVADYEPATVIREALTQFHARNGRYPSPGNSRNLESVSKSIHEHITIRCTDTPWWAHDTWNLRLDERIPRRDHEPVRDRTINLAGIEPAWLREGIRYWLSQSLLHDQLTWTTAATRISTVGTRFGRFAATRGLEGPAIAADLPGLRAVFLDYLSFLRSPEATTTGDCLAPASVTEAQSHLQSFYTFMADNADAAANFTGDERWADLNVNHTRLWAPQNTPRRRGNTPEHHYYTETEVGALLAHLPVLAAPRDRVVSVEHAGVTRQFVGFGDPQAARVWELQFLTGRRASEILMMDREPLRMLDLGTGPDSGPADPDAFVARMRYQQTKVDGVDPTVLVTQAAVDIVREQQHWVADNHPDAVDGPYLFLQLRGNHRGLHPRTYNSYSRLLARFNAAINLTTADGRPLSYSKTYYLRHTRATTLLNAGVPIHVLMRYLGHKGPEMTMRYAATLDSTAIEALTKYKQVGADGREITLNPRDLIDLRDLDKRADRMLPNGVCLLPPTKTCDKGNACLPCGSFATDASYLDEHRAQRERIAALIHVRQEQFERRHGTPMPEANTWLQGRLRELASLDAIIARLEQDDTGAGSVKGPGVSGKTTPLTLTTDPASRAAAHQALQDRLTPPTHP